MELEYLIIYTNEGVPIYAKCFADVCKTAIGNPTLFSAFLATLGQFAEVDPSQLPEKIDFDGSDLTITKGLSGIQTIQLDEFQLLFLQVQLDGITIAAGFNSERYQSSQIIPIFTEFLHDVELFMQSYHGVTWQDITIQYLTEFEINLLHEVVYPFFGAHDIQDTCVSGDKCPFRIAIYEERYGTIFERLYRKVREYREVSIFQKIKKRISRTHFQLVSSYKINNKLNI